MNMDYPKSVDLLIIGGGINGVGVAVDAAGRGLSVLLCERDDLGAHTSSESSKLIHGGLRYLKTFQFKLVHEALKEREILIQKAPYLVHPLRFVLPFDKRFNPAWVIRAGLFLYDHLARRHFLAKSRSINLRKNNEGISLKEEFRKGFTYTDCFTDDSRLVVINAMHAREQGATIMTHTECVSAKRSNHDWVVTLKRYDETFTVKARAIVNAAGPWVVDVSEKILQVPVDATIKLVKGSHFTVPKLYDGNFAYILQNSDKRIVFVIPYRDEFSLIGTTDVDFSGDYSNLSISPEETDYLLEVVNFYFKKSIKRSDINWTYSGVRPLYDNHTKDLSKITREYHIEVDKTSNAARLISIFGGKLTTYRALAEHVVDKLQPDFPFMEEAWTSRSLLPGGELEGKNIENYTQEFFLRYKNLPQNLIRRYAMSYGNRCESILSIVKSVEDLGIHFGADLYEREVIYLCDQEWAESTDDILWRRTKLGLHFKPEEVQKLDSYLKEMQQKI